MSQSIAVASGPVPVMQVVGRVTQSSIVVAQDRPVQLVQFNTGMISLYQDGVPLGWWPQGKASLGVRTDYVEVRSTPTWATVVAIVGFFFVFVFSLLFLLVKETRRVPAHMVVLTLPEGGTVQVRGTLRHLPAMA